MAPSFKQLIAYLLALERARESRCGIVIFFVASVVVSSVMLGSHVYLVRLSRDCAKLIVNSSWFLMLCRSTEERLLTLLSVRVQQSFLSSIIYVHALQRLPVSVLERFPEEKTDVIVTYCFDSCITYAIYFIANCSVVCLVGLVSLLGIEDAD